MNTALETFEDLFSYILKRFVKSSTGSRLKLKETLSLEKAHSVVDEDSSEVLFKEVFDVIFFEINKYIKSQIEFYAMDWNAYLTIRSDENYMRKDDKEDANKEEEKKEGEQEIINTSSKKEKKEDSLKNLKEQFAASKKVYNENFLLRLLAIVDTYTNVANALSTDKQ